MDINMYILLYFFFFFLENFDILLAKGASYLLHFGVLDREDHLGLAALSSVGWTRLRIRTVLTGNWIRLTTKHCD